MTKGDISVQTRVAQADTPVADRVTIYAKDTVERPAGEWFYKGDDGQEFPMRGDELPVVDTTAIVKGSGDDTKLMRIEVDGLTTGTTRVLTMPDADITPDDAGDSRVPSGPASGDLTGSYPSPILANTAVTPGAYTSSDLVVDAKGRITSISDGISGLVAAGSDTEVQFNNAGALGASANLKYAGTTLTLGGSPPRLDVIATSGESAFIRIGENLVTPMVLEFDGSGSDKGLHIYGTTPGKNSSFLIERDTNIVRIRDPKSSSSTTTGALTVVGGVGVGGSQHIGDDLFVNGDVNVNGTLQTQGAHRRKLTAKTANFTFDTTMDIVSIACDIGDTTGTLPPLADAWDATTETGLVYKVIRATAGTVTNKCAVQGDGAELIEDKNDFLMAHERDEITLIAGPAKWVIIDADVRDGALLAADAASTDIITAAPTLIDAFTNDSLTSPNLIEADAANDTITVERTISATDVITVEGDFVFEFDNNINIIIELYKDGSPLVPAIRTGSVGRGAGNLVSCSMKSLFSLPSGDAPAVYTLQAFHDGGGNKTVTWQIATFTIQRG